MSLFGKIGSVLDPGGSSRTWSTQSSPRNWEIVGDLAGAATDIAEGNPAGAAKHALEALRDLPQAAKAVTQALNGTGGATKSICGQSGGWRGTPSFEPRPPAHGPQVNVTVNGGQVSITINETALRWPRLQAAIDSVWQGSVHGAAHGAATPTTSAPVSTGAPTISSNPGNTAAAGAPTASAGGSINSIDQMNGLSDAAFMSAVRERKDLARRGQRSGRHAANPGANEPDHADEPADEQMLAAMHQMAMSTIQNIRA